MPRIVFICTKNQFRSPLAEVMLRNLLTTRNTPGEWIVESAGSWVDKLSPATHEAIIEAKKRGIPLVCAKRSVGCVYSEYCKVFGLSEEFSCKK